MTDAPTMPFLGALPLLEQLDELQQAGFTGALRVALPGEEVRVFIRAGEPRFCTGSAASHSFGAWLLRSGALDAADLKALAEKASGGGARLEDVLISEGRLSPEKLRAAQQAMSHHTFADVAARGRVDARSQALEPPKVIDGFRLDPLRAVIEYTVRHEPPRFQAMAGCTLQLGPRFDAQRSVFERVFGSLFQTVAGRLAAGGLTLPSSNEELLRLSLALVRTGAAVVAAPAVARPDPRSVATSEPSLRATPPGAIAAMNGLPVGLLPTPGIPPAEVAGLAGLLAELGLMATPVAAIRSRTPPVTEVRAVRGRVPGTPTPVPVAAPASVAGELPPLQELGPPGSVVADTPGSAPDAALRAALERAMAAASESEPTGDIEVFAVTVDPRTGATVSEPRAEPSRPPDSGARERMEASSGSSVAKESAARTTPRAVPASASRPNLPPGIEQRPSGVVLRTARPSPSGAEPRAESAAPPASATATLDDEIAEVTTMRRRVDRGDAFATLGLQAGAPMSAIREAYVARRARFDPSRFEGRTVPVSVQGDLELVAGRLDAAYSELTTRATRAPLEAAAGGLSALDLSNYFGADQLFREGRKAHANRDFRGAHQCFLKALQRWARDPDYGVWAAQAYWDMQVAEGNWSDGGRGAVERLLRDALALGPRHELAQVLLARLELERGRPVEALQLYRSVVEQNPGNTEARSAVQELAPYAAPAAPTTGRILGGLAARLVSGIRGEPRNETRNEKGGAG